MKPTAKLRFVKRKDFTEDPANPRTLCILQQWWEHEEFLCDEMRVTAGEWRDVPIEKEQT
jgi:hypothetical protein